MPPEQNRRKFLCLVGGAASIATAGCQSLTPSNNASEPPLSLQIFNYTSDPQKIAVEIIDPDVDEYPEAVVYGVSSVGPERPTGIQPPSEGEGIANVETFEDVAETQPYTVRFRISGDRPERWRHVHYKPESGTDDHFITLRIYQDDETNEEVVRVT